MGNTSRITYTKEGESHKNGILSLLSLVFPNQDFISEFEHSSYENPISNYKPMGFVALADNQVVGYRGFTIIPFLVGGKPINMAIPNNTATHPNYRRQGIFSNLIKLSLETLVKELPYIFNISANANAVPANLKFDWLVLGKKDYLIKTVLFSRRFSVPEKYEFSLEKNDLLNAIGHISNKSQISSNSNIRIDLNNEPFVEWIFTRPDYQYLTIKTDRNPFGYMCFTLSGNTCKIIHFDFMGERSNLTYMLKYIAKKFDISYFYFFTSKKDHLDLKY